MDDSLPVHSKEISKPLSSSSEVGVGEEAARSAAAFERAISRLADVHIEGYPKAGVRAPVLRGGESVPETEAGGEQRSRLFLRLRFCGGTMTWPCVAKPFVSA